MVESSRVVVLADYAPTRVGSYVLYWMQQSQRTRFNHALEFAVGRANALGLPLVVCFGLTDAYPGANARHFLFMLQGLADVERGLAARGVKFVVKHGNPAEVALHYAKRAAAVVCDRGYLRHQRAWRRVVGEGCEREGIPAYQVESDAVVPVGVASNKREYAARTLRPKIRRHLAEYLKPVRVQKVARPSLGLKLKGDVDVRSPEAALAGLKVDHSVAPVGRFFVGGEGAARERLKRFVRSGLAGYAEERNEPAADQTSHLSAYLHFGQVSAVEVALAARRSGAPAADVDAYVEELVVRRELAINFCEYTDNYDSYDAVPGWAKQTLKDRAGDERPHVYTRAQLEAARTGDPYWNAAQTEMVATGFMHNYMRMYWGKKVVEWSRSAAEAYETLLYLNDRYFLCGRDPNGYANVGWIFGLHDRPWGPARPVFGTVRYMNATGMERKFDMDAYVQRVARL
jgi:deoxyribodipyrimidine photo-lyase